MVSAEKRSRWRMQSRRRWIVVIGLLVTPVILFAWNGLVSANNESPIGFGPEITKSDNTDIDPDEVKVLSYNLAKGFAYRESEGFVDAEQVRKRMDQVAELINEEKPDLVFLSEVIFECGPCPVNQVEYLVKATGMTSWAFGENYNFGLPFYRIVGGNAILSRWPIKPLDNPSLSGRQPFYVTKNNRRVLWCELTLGKEKLLLASVHNDSYNMENNLTQAKELLDYCEGKPAILAGDFNAKRDQEPIKLIEGSERFSGKLDGPMTFPASAPNQTIDFIFAPRTWELKWHEVPDCHASDHLPVTSTFRRR